MRARREQVWCACCHLANLVPVWGLLICGYVWHAHREESRIVVRQALLAMMFHAQMLAMLVLWMAVNLLVRLCYILSPALSVLLDWANDAMALLLYAAYAAFCLYGFRQAIHGRAFRYPLPLNRS